MKLTIPSNILFNIGIEYFYNIIWLDCIIALVTNSGNKPI